MSQTIHVVKQQGNRASEPFSTDKLHHSVQAACLSVRAPEGEAALIANRVVAAVSTWVHDKSTITSNDVRRIASRGLDLFHPEAAYMYKNHGLVV